MKYLDSLDRLPTKGERFLGAVASLLIFAFAVAAIAFIAYWLFRRPQIASTVVILVLCGFVVLALWGAYMFVKIVWGTPKKPSASGQLIVGLVATIGAAAYLVMVFFIARSVGQINPSAGVAAATIFVSGIVWSYHAWKRLRA